MMRIASLLLVTFVTVASAPALADEDAVPFGEDVVLPPSERSPSSETETPPANDAVAPDDVAPSGEEVLPPPVETPLPVEPEPFTFALELPLTLSATPASSGVETSVTAWPGVRGTILHRLDGGLLVGGDLMLSGTFDNAGTSRVSATRFFAGLEGRGLVALSLGGPFARFLPYGYTGPFVGLGVGFLKGGDDDALRFLASPGWRAGVGAMVRLGIVQVRLDLGAGVRDWRFETTTSASLGLAF